MVREAGIRAETAERPLTRGQRIWQRMLEARAAGKLSLERARLLTSSYKETEGLPAPIRRARAFEKIVTGIPIYIDDEQLLVGDFAAGPMWAEWYPECAVNWVLEDIQRNAQAYKADKDEFAEQLQICEYWKTRTIEYAVLSHLSEAERQRLRDTSDKGAFVHFVEGKLDRLPGYQVIKYNAVITKGLRGIIARVEKELEKVSPPLDDEALAKENFLRALVMVYEAAIKYAGRYARLAREKALSAEGERKAELEKIAAICDRVPAQPARTFHEAVQAMWFTHVLAWLEGRVNGLSPGRADQYLYPYYKRDIEKGRLTREEAIQILECLRPKMSGHRNFSIASHRELASGDAQFHNVTLGGVTADGKDATNEVSYLFLEAADRARTPHHTLSIRVHEKSPRDFLLRAVRLSAAGCGYPAFFPDKPHMDFLVKYTGATPAEARDFAIGGCVVPQVPGKSGATTALAFNITKCFELALFNGFDPVTRKQIGPPTGRFEDFQTYAGLVRAYVTQLRHFSLEAVRFMNLNRAYIELMAPPLFYSGLIENCIRRGKSGQGAGAKYRIAYHNATGMIDVADSLAAVKKCVFEDGSIGKKDLIKALETNFAGMESARKLLLAAPKYGNDDDYVDFIARDLYDQWQKMVHNELDSLYGDKWIPCAYSVSSYTPMGKKVGALPSGRLAGESLSDGSTSACRGMDMKGPTAVLNSAAKIDQLPIESTLLNMKFQPAVLKSDEDLKKLLALIKTYLQNGGKHIQFNVVDRATLIDAQQHPERHRNLLVRVAGYSALFVELSKGVQNDIIERTAHEL